MVTNEHNANHVSVKPAEEVVEATAVPQSEVTVPTPTEEDIEDEGEDFFSYVLMLAIFTVIGVMMWWAGVHKHLMKIRGRSTKTSRGRYSRASSRDDVEKGRD